MIKMQYLNTISNKVSSIEEFLNICSIYEYKEDKNKFGYLYINKDKPLITYDKLVCNVMFALSNGDYIINFRTYIHDSYMNVSYENDRIFLLRVCDPTNLYEVVTLKTRINNEIGQGKSYIIKLVDPHIAAKAFDRISTAITVEYFNNVLSKCNVTSVEGDNIKYDNGCYYIGKHKDGERLNYGIFVMPDNFIYIGTWYETGCPCNGTIIFLSNDKRIMMSIKFSNIYIKALASIYNTKIITNLYNISNIGKLKDSKRLENGTFVFSDNIIMAGEYLITLDNFEIIPRSKIYEEYKLKDKSHDVMWLKIMFNNTVIIIDERSRYIFESGYINKIAISLTSCYSDYGTNLEIQIGPDSFMYSISNENTDEQNITDIVPYNSNYDFIDAIGENMDFGFRIKNDIIYIEENSAKYECIYSITINLAPFVIESNMIKVDHTSPTKSKCKNVMTIDSNINPKLEIFKV